MTSFRDIVSAAGQRRLEYLVIGGLAVIFHAYSRDTADLDLLIRRTARPGWLEVLGSLGYTTLRDAGSFLQLAPPPAGAWPVDLMLVGDATFAPMALAAAEVEMFGAKVRIPSLEHLMALKLHALKHGRVERFAKDFLDLEGLARANAVDLRSETIRQLFLKYGTLDIYERICRTVTRS